MDKKATRPSRLEEKEEWTSVPASPHGENTLEVQAQTQDPVQPLDYFHIGQRTMSPPPVALEKARAPSPGSYPDTPAASTTSGFSRSSTIDSSKSQDSAITLYSQKTSSSDDTISVPRSLSFPVMGFSPLDRDSLPNAAHIRVLRLLESVSGQHTGVPVSMNWPSPASDDRHLPRPLGRGEEPATQNNQAVPSRHSTFPIGRLRNSSNLDDTHSSMLSGNEDPTDPDASEMGDQLPEDAATAVPEMRHDLTKQETASDEAHLPSLPVQTDMFLKGRFAATDRWVVGSFDHKLAGLNGPFVSSSSTESFLHYRRRLSRRHGPYKGAGRTVSNDVAFWHYEGDGERPCSRNGHMLSIADPLVNSEAVAGPGSPKRFELQNQADDMAESLSSCSSPRMNPSAEEYRELSPTDSDDIAHSPGANNSPASEDDEDFAYDKLVESITDLIFESSCVGNVEERGVPVKLFVHSLLEQILNHQKPATVNQVLRLPIRSLPKQNNDVPNDAGELNMGARGQGGHGGGGGGGGGNKRKTEDAPDHNHYRAHGDDDNPCDSSEEDENSSPQQAKKQKTGKRSRNFSCPFRKRNPIRFNVRTHYSCACNSFADFALLKRHIKHTHQKANGLFSCVRCKTTFTNQPALEGHLTQLESCKLITSTGNEDPEDGITGEVGRALQARTKDANIRSWKTLWTHLFPNDSLEDIPDPDHEPPIELEEVQDHCYQEGPVREFVQNQPVEEFLSDHGFRYLAESLRRCRGTDPDKVPRKRRDQDQRFEIVVRNAVLTHNQCTFAALQTHPAPGFAPDPWEAGFNTSNEQPFGINPNMLSSQFSETYTGNPAYGTSSHGFDGDSHIPAVPGTVYHSSEDVAQSAPQHPSMSIPYGAIQNGRPCSAAEGNGRRSSAHRSSAQYSSALSSQPSRESGELRTPQTLETQETMDTQYTQPQDAALDHHPDHHNLPHAANGRPGVPDQSSSDLNLYGVGTKLSECPGLDGSNGDGDLGPFPNMQ